MTEDYIRIFSQTAIADILDGKDKQMISISKSEDVEKLLSVLYENSLSSVPVTDNRVIGFVSTDDILSLLIKLFKNITLESSEDDIRLLSMGFLNSNVNNIMDLSSKDCFKIVLQETSLYETLKLYSQGIHRLALLTVFSDIEDIVSQSNVIKFLNNNLSVLGNQLGNAKLGSSEILSFLPSKQSLVTTKNSTSTIDSFKLMSEHKVSAIPVLDDSSNQIIGTLSVNDLYGINQETIRLLLDQTGKFISLDNKQIKSSKKKPDHQIVLKLDNTFSDAIKTISLNEIHRVWLVDDNNTPISLISLTDICKIIVESPYLFLQEQIEQKQQQE